jgi:hypothetical protein
MLIFYVFICFVSFALRSSVSLNIRNRYQVIKLTSPVHFIHGGKWYAVPDQEIDINAVMRDRIEFDSGQDVLEGALVYNMQRQHTKSDKLIQNEPKYIQLLVSWRVECTKELHVHALLVEHDKEFNWDEDKLRRLYQKYWHSLKAWVSPITINWLLDDATVLMATVIIRNGDYKWNVFISERMGDGIERPLWVDAKR